MIDKEKLINIKNKEMKIWKQRSKINDKSKNESNNINFNRRKEDNKNLKEDELEEIETELKLLSNSEGIKNALNRAYVELSEGEQPLVQPLVGSFQHHPSGF